MNGALLYAICARTMRKAAILVLVLVVAVIAMALAACSSCRSAPPEQVGSPESGWHPSTSDAAPTVDAPADGPLALDGAVTAKGPIDKQAAQKIAFDYAMEHWRRYHPEQASILAIGHGGGDYRVLVEFKGRKVVATVFVRPGDGTVSDAGIYVPDGS